ncbi:MAG: rhomboid family intramembrane serine protease [Pseudomonadota bacterium]
MIEHEERRTRRSTLICWLVLLAFTGLEIAIIRGDLLRGPLIETFAFQDLTDGIRTLQAPDWRLVSYQFLHAHPFHAAANITLFLLIAPALCRKIGGFRWLIIYLLSGVVGALAHAAPPGTGGLLVGASGAIYGLLGVGKLWEALYLIRTTGPWSRYLTSLFFFAGLNVVMVMVSGGAAAWMAHLGGALTGAILASLLMPKGPDGRMII